MTTETIERPEGLTDEHLEYLDDLRESGVTNMFGAAPYLADAFDLDTPTARKYLSYWMKTFGGAIRSSPRLAPPSGRGGRTMIELNFDLDMFMEEVSRRDLVSFDAVELLAAVLRTERASRAALLAEVERLRAACDEAHQLLWHYDIIRQPNGVDWGPPEMLRTEVLDKLGAALDTPQRPEAAEAARAGEE